MTRPESLHESLGILLRFMHYFSPMLRKQYVLITGSFLALFAQTMLEILQPWPLKFVIDRITSSSHTHTHAVGGQLFFPSIEALDATTLIIFSAIAVVAIAGLRAAVGYYNTIGFAVVGNRVLTEVRNMLYRHVQYLSLSFHTKARSGDLILRVMSDVSMLKEISVTAFLPLLGNILVLVGMVAVMFWLHWQLTLLTLAVTPLFFLSAISKSRKIQRVARKQRKREGMMAATVAESIEAIKEVQALSLNETFFNAFSSQSNKTLGQDVKAQRLQAGLERTMEVLIALATALVLWYGALLVLGKELTPGDLVVFLAYLGSAFRPVRNFAKYSGRLAKASAACERVLEVLERKLDVDDLPGAIEAPLFRGDVRFENVSFAFEPDTLVLENIDFRVASGQRIALVGASGSGKSTLVSLILRLYDCTRGRVMIDGRDIREYTLASLRRQISVVLQDNVLFAVSVKDNIAYGSPNATLEEIETAARLANAHQFIKALTHGYDTILSERGVTLSKGQRQRIAIARAAIRRAPILILDEPTTGLDEENERTVIEAMERLEHDCTTFLVTHNLEHAAHADVILYLEDGRVVERGTHAELMQINGLYAALYKMHAAIQTSQ